MLVFPSDKAGGPRVLEAVSKFGEPDRPLDPACLCTDGYCHDPGTNGNADTPPEIGKSA
jgi:hypothetical protein